MLCAADAAPLGHRNRVADPFSPVQVVDLIKEYNTLGRNCIALMLDTKGPEVRSGDLSAPIDLVPGARPCAGVRCGVRPVGLPSGAHRRT